MRRIGQIGVAALLSVAFLVLSMGPAAPPVSAHTCPLTQGYWKTHPEAWNAASLQLGSVTYTQSQLLQILNTPVAGDASIILAYQLIAALLNQANGSLNFPPAVQSAIDVAIGAAHALIGSNNLLSSSYNVAPSSSTGQQMVAVAATLELFNSGVLTQGICGNF